MSRFSQNRSRVLVFLLLVFVTAAGVGSSLYFLASRPSGGAAVKVLAYSGFLASWGPGPELARLFEVRTGLKIEFRDGGDAGLLLRKLELFPSDVVIGLDQLSLPVARASAKWRKLPSDLTTGLVSGLPLADILSAEGEFVALDWAPLAFVFRRGEIEPPRALRDLADPRFQGRIALIDPRTSTPGLQFYLWILDEMGEEEGLRFLSGLRPNLHSISPGWSQAYGLFTKRQAQLAFSYLTSPVYHVLNEKDESYQAAVFADGHPVQVEYVGIPESCDRCDAAQMFVRFLLEPEAQKLVMTRNVMLPVRAEVRRETEFQNIPDFKLRRWKSVTELLQARDRLFARWQELGL